MSKVSTIYDTLVSLVSSNLTSYIQMPNPYTPEDTNEIYSMKKTFGISFGEAVNTERFVSCNKVGIARTYTILLVNPILTTDHDTSKRATLEKNMLEDQFTIIKALELDPALGEVSTNATYTGDTGIDFLEGDREKYFITELSVSIEYLENLT